MMFHVTMTEEIPGEPDMYRSPPRFRWVCSCGKRGRGSHGTIKAALAVSLHHAEAPESS